MRLQKGQNPNRPPPGSRIKVEPVRNLQVGDALDLKQSKTRTCRMVTLNRPSVEAIRHYLRNDRHLLMAEDDATCSTAALERS
jgi:site-specific recombinase XerD